jgi:hypothetical protein
MDDSQPNNKRRYGNVFQTKEKTHEGHTLQQRHAIKNKCPLKNVICHLLCIQQKLECCCSVKSCLMHKYVLFLRIVL